MEKQVLSVEQMQELNAFGIDVSKASMCYCILASDEYHFGKALVPNSETFCKALYRELVIPTFTLQDILQTLPKLNGYYYPDLRQVTEQEWQIIYKPKRGDLEWLQEYGTTALEAAYNMLMYCIKNKYI